MARRKRPVQSEFFQDACVQHCSRRRRGGIGFRRPCVKRKERDENSETDKQQQINMPLRVRSDLAHSSCSPQHANIKTPRSERKALVKQDQAEQQNETADGQVDRDFPGRCDPIPAAPDSDQQKCGDQREFVKRVKEK